MKRFYLFILIIIVFNNYCLAQNNQASTIKYFLYNKDSIISKFLLSKIDTTSYRCVYQESSGIYSFISQNKCYLYLKSRNSIDSLSNKFIFEIPYILTIGENRIDSLAREKDSGYSPFGTLYYFEKSNAADTIYFYTEFSILLRDKITNRIGNDLFNLLGFAKIKLGLIPNKKKHHTVSKL